MPSALEPVAGRNIEPKPTAPMRRPLLLQLLYGATVRLAAAGLWLLGHGLWHATPRQRHGNQHGYRHNT